jgi:NTE family protein
VLGLKWKTLKFNGSGQAENLIDQVMRPVMELASRTIDERSIIGGILNPFKSISEEVADAYRKYLFGNATLQDLPADDEGPRFVINATNVQSKVLWRFSRKYMGDYRIGLIPNPRVELAVAVGASSAFPPVLSPVRLKLNPAQFDPASAGDLHVKPYVEEAILSDGGVYDNLGLETAWKEYETVLVSDGGGATPDEPKPHTDWARHSYRVLQLMDNQVGSLRKRWVIGSYTIGLRKGAYWGIRTNISDYKLPGALNAPFEKSIALADTPTRLKKMDLGLQQQLINWGYAVCDAAMRAHVVATTTASKFPFEGGLG